jgi:hypothetical protein
MNFAFKKKGDWMKIRRTLQRRKERMDAMRKRIMRDLVEATADAVKEPLPNTEEMALYKKSIQPREIKTSAKEGELAYALVSDPVPLELSNLGEENHVIYVLHEGTQTDALGLLLIDHGPWVKSRLPANLADVPNVRMIHRQVTSKEVDKVRALNDKTLKDHKREFEVANAQVKKKEAPDPPASVPDIMFQAIRMEFGIMMQPTPHWKRAYDLRMAILKELLSDKKKYSQYIWDADFNGWVQRVKKWKPLSAQSFKKNYAKFDKKVTGG